MKKHLEVLAILALLSFIFLFCSGSVGLLILAISDLIKTLHMP